MLYVVFKQGFAGRLCPPSVLLLQMTVMLLLMFEAVPIYCKDGARCASVKLLTNLHLELHMVF